jgi:hypothetical protein
VHKKRLLIRLLSGAVVTTVTAGTALLMNGVANAAPPAGTLGSDTISPSQGADTTPMSSMTSAGCTPDSEAADLTIVGPVGADGTAPETATFPSSDPFPVTTIGGAETGQFSTAGPFTQQFRVTLKAAAQSRGTMIQTGEYDLTTHCMDQFGFTVFGTFTAGIIFDTPTHYSVIANAGTPTPTPVVTPTPTPTPVVTPTPTPTPVVTPTPTPTPVVTPTPTPRPTPVVTPRPTPTPTPRPTPTPAPGAHATTTTLTVIKIDFPGPGGLVLPLANVAPSNAAGTVQFKDGNTNLDGPRQVFAGIAIGPLTFLNQGQHTITAVFTPADPAAFLPSMSNAESVRFEVRFCT